MSEPLSTTDMLSAQSSLDQLMARVGVDGLVAAFQRPGLLAMVDQHVAAIRESLAAAGREIDAISLAWYARSVLSFASKQHQGLPDPDSIDWRAADWYVLRLVAVCALADAVGCL